MNTLSRPSRRYERGSGIGEAAQIETDWRNDDPIRCPAATDGVLTRALRVREHDVEHVEGRLHRLDRGRRDPRHFAAVVIHRDDRIGIDRAQELHIGRRAQIVHEAHFRALRWQQQRTERHSSSDV